MCFALREEQALFSGDHVMAWATSVIAPPDGDMAQYFDSLRKLRVAPSAKGGEVLGQNLVHLIFAHGRVRSGSMKSCRILQATAPC
jgi:glyoxylase-like metal-dependent hydrolase (beta-lactamase superfamily II)